MMRKTLTCLALSASILCTSCLGSFNAFNGLKEWNQEVTDSKYVNNILYWAISPVYGLFYLGDAVIFNTIEFWTGSNPIAMSEGEIEIQTIENEGQQIRMTATKNKMEIEVLEGVDKGKKVNLVFTPEEKSWKAIKQDGEVIKLSSFEDGMYVVYLPNQEEVRIDPAMSREEALALLDNKTFQFEDCAVAAK